jgi:bifunctional non-homologous end joining protein LigD
VPLLRREVAKRFKDLQIDACPFANLPEKKRTQWALTKEEMKNCVWLRPELVAQVEFTEWTPDGHLRHSRFVGLREDKSARESCTGGLKGRSKRGFTTYCQPL